MKTSKVKIIKLIIYSDIDTDNIAVNKLAHEYLTEERSNCGKDFTYYR